MKSIILPLIVLLALAGFATTVKKEKKAPVYRQSLHGEWKGQYCVDAGPFVNPLLFEFGDDLRLQVSDGPREWGDKASGSYYLSGDTLKARYRYEAGIQDMVTVTAIVKENSIEGTWEWVKGKGKLVLSKSGNTFHLQKTTVR